jgi:hypothetical protein
MNWRPLCYNKVLWIEYRYVNIVFTKCKIIIMIKLKQILIQESIANVIKDYDGKVKDSYIYFWNAGISNTIKNRDILLRYACKLYLNEVD